MTANHDPSDPRAQQPRSDQQPPQRSGGQPQGRPHGQQQGAPRQHSSTPHQGATGQPHRQQSAHPQPGQGAPPQGGQHGTPQERPPQGGGLSPQPTQGAQGASLRGGRPGAPQGGSSPGGGAGAPGARGMSQGAQPPQPTQPPQQQPRRRGARGRAGRPMLDPITIEDIVAEDVVTAQRDTPVQTVVAGMAENDVGTVVVVDDGEPIGVITDRKVALTLEESPDVSQRTAEDLIGEDVVTADSSMTVFDVLQRMSDEGIRRLPVTDDENRLQGIVSLDDVIVLLGTELGNVAETIQSQIDRL